MILPDTNNFKDGSKFLYLTLEDYKKDFPLLKQNFFLKYNTNEANIFIEEEVGRYERFISILSHVKPDKRSKANVSEFMLRKLITTAYNGLDIDYKTTRGLPSHCEQLDEYGKGPLIDDTFVIVAFKSILSFLKNEIEGKIHTKSITPLDFDLNQSEVIYLFDLLIEANLLKIPKAHTGGYYTKLETYFTAQGKPIKDAKQKRNKYIESKSGRPSTSIILKEKLLKVL